MTVICGVSQPTTTGLHLTSQQHHQPALRPPWEDQLPGHPCQYPRRLPYNLKLSIKLLPPIFVLVLSWWFRNSFSFKLVDPVFSLPEILTSLNPKAVFDSSKEAFWCTERNTKDPISLKRTVTEKIKKNLQWDNVTSNALIVSHLKCVTWKKK